MFVDFFIRRPIFATVVALIIVLAGAISIPSLPVDQFPDLAPPTVVVAANYTGASAAEVESAVTTPLEEAINGAENLMYISSSSTNQGSAQITCTFTTGSNLDLDTVEVENRVNSAEGPLPATVKQSGITVTKASTGFVFGAGFYSPNHQYSNLFISNYLSIYVEDALKRVPGVAGVTVFGEGQYAMRIWLDPNKLAGRGLTATDVLTALENQNVQIAAGAVGMPPAPTGQQYQFQVMTSGQLSTPQQFDNIVLATEPDGTIIRLSDVGYAQLGAQTYSSALSYSGQPAVGLGVQQLSTANALAVDAAAKAELAKLAPRFPPGLEYGVAFDSTTAIGESIQDVLITLLETIIIVVLVIFFFLQDWRTTLIPSVTIPVALIGTFIFIKAFHFSINTLTLFGIVLATGLVVDDAIVVIENVERHIAAGMRDAHRATSEAMVEITSVVIATSLVLVAVFVPVALFPGTTGILFRQFALTIAFSIIISAFNALTLTPSMSAILLREIKHKRGFWAWLEGGIEGLSHGYKKAVSAALRVRWLVVLVFLGVLVATYFTFYRVPEAFIPQEDEGMIMLLIQAPDGASLQYTEHIVAEAESVVSRQPEVTGAFAITGFSFAGAGSNTGMMFVSLKPFSERKGAQHSAAAIIARLRPQLFMIPGALVAAFPPPTIRGLGNFGGFQFEVLDQGGGTPQQLAAATHALVAAGNANPHLTGLLTSYTANTPEYMVQVDRSKAESLNVPFSQITDTLETFLGSVYVNNFTFDNRTYDVFVQAEQQFRNQAQDINQYYVRSNSVPPQMIPLGNLVQITEQSGPVVINHYDLFRSAEIDGSAAPGTSSGQAIQTMEKLAKQVLPHSMSYAWTGLSLQQIQSGSQVVMLFGLGLLVVFLVLAAQYESWVLPFVVMLAVPAALLGALGAQWLRGLNDDIYCQIGLVMLIGLSTKNAILIVEFAEQLRDRGMQMLEATIEAARIRLRPILMTSVAFMLGIVPLMVATGAGAAGQNSVGTAVFGGMFLATLLNLFFIPTLYIIFRGIFPGGGRHTHLPAAPAERVPEPAGSHLA
ncbi:MAG: efflux RND transporter permease subunit [Terriglobales bacterium]